MGHHINAVILRGPYDPKLASIFDLRAIRLSDELTLFPLAPSYTDHWAGKLHIFGHVSEQPMLHGYRILERRERDGWAADLYERR